MPKGALRKNPLEGRRHAAVRLPRHTERRTRALRMLASPRSSDEDEEDVPGSMADVLIIHGRQATPAEKRLANATPGASFLMKYMLVPLIVLFAGPLIIANSGLLPTRNMIDVAQLCREEPNLPCSVRERN